MSEGYSHYADEDEILVQDGLEYLVTDNLLVDDTNTGNKYYWICLKYPV